MPLPPTRKQLFEQCVDEQADAMFRVAFRLTGCRDTASELVQETYMAAWINLDSLRDPAKLKSWLFAILRNQFHKGLRKKQLQFSLLDSDSVMAPNSVTNDRSDDDVSAQIQTTVDQLPNKQKMPLLLVTMEGMSVMEAAEVLEIPRGTLLSRLHRAKQKVKSAIQRRRTVVEETE